MAQRVVHKVADLPAARHLPRRDLPKQHAKRPAACQET